MKIFLKQKKKKLRFERLGFFFSIDGFYKLSKLYTNLDFYKFFMTKELQVAVNDFKQTIVGSYNKELTNYFLNNEAEKLKFLSWVIYAINKVPKLLECSRDTLINSVLELAQIWMAPWLSWEVYILPYKWKATALIWYQWYVTLLYKAWISSIYAEIVRKNDKFENIMWSEPKIDHRINPTHSLAERWEPIWAYVVVKVNWEKIHKFMTKEEIMKFKEFSQSKGSDFSPWNEKNDPELNMWKKTVLKQIIKYLPKNEKIVKAIEIDNMEAPVNKKEVITWWEEDKKKLDEIFNNLESNPKENEPK